MPDDSIMDMVNNIEPLYNDKNNLYRKWIRDDEEWNEKTAFKEARALAAHFAEAIEAMPDWPELRQPHYRGPDFDLAASEMIQEFKTEERPKWSATPAAAPAPSPWSTLTTLTPEQQEHADKYEALAKAIGVDFLKSYLPVPASRIQAALEKGDVSLTSIPLRKWDAAASSIPVAAIITANPKIPGGNLTMSQRVSLLKHVARWHTSV